MQAAEEGLVLFLYTQGYTPGQIRRIVRARRGSRAAAEIAALEPLGRQIGEVRGRVREPTNNSGPGA